MAIYKFLTNCQLVHWLWNDQSQGNFFFFFFFCESVLIIFLHTGMKSAAYRPADYRRNTLRGSSVSSLEEVSRTLKRTKDPYSASRPWLK